VPTLDTVTTRVAVEVVPTVVLGNEKLVWLRLNRVEGGGLALDPAPPQPTDIKVHEISSARVAHATTALSRGDSRFTAKSVSGTVDADVPSGISSLDASMVDSF
jgi:hypothetical protein